MSFETDTDLKIAVQDFYREILSSNHLKPRSSQKLMIAGIVNHIGSDDSLNNKIAIEAGTGTGKTLAYLVACIPFIRRYEKCLIISTATVSLQNQLLMKDLPEIHKLSSINFSWALAKGRRRYLCPLKTENIIEGFGLGESSSQKSFPDIDNSHDDFVVKEMAERWTDNSWDGDLDNFDKNFNDSIRTMITVDHQSCDGRGCRLFNCCPYFKARENWLNADIVIVNHDLLLADQISGGSAIPDLKSSVLVIDEAHQVAKIALKRFQHHFKVFEGLNVINEMKELISSLSNSDEERYYQNREKKELEKQLEILGEIVLEWGITTKKALRGSSSIRWSHELSARIFRLTLKEILTMPRQREVKIEWIINTLNKLINVLRDLKNPEAKIKRNINRLINGLEVLSELKFINSAFSEIGYKSQSARWIKISDKGNLCAIDESTDLEMCMSPLTPATKLDVDFWRRTGTVIFTSATLTYNKKFAKFSSFLGLTNLKSLTIPSEFDYKNQGTLTVHPNAISPKREEGHAELVSDYISTLWDRNYGVLVLFTSWRFLYLVEKGLTQECRLVTLVQGQKPFSKLIAVHKRRCSEKKTSILFGLQSMSEGLDLPGNSLMELVITRLPFCPPDDPVDATYSDYLENLGSDPFFEISLPQASIRLRQSVGRLIRSPTDSGKITFMDDRLISTSWGKKLLFQLPPFKFIIGAH